MDYIIKLIKCYLEVHKNIIAFQFVIYSSSQTVKVREFYRIDVTDLPGKLEWLLERKLQLAEENQLYPIALTIGLVNEVLIPSRGKGKTIKRYIPMIDFRGCIPSSVGAPENILMALELLDMGPGIIVRSSAVDFFGEAGFHFFGFNLWNKRRWKQFISDGVYDEYGVVQGRRYPMFPKIPFYAAKIIGESWCQLVNAQNGVAFLRVAENFKEGSQPEVVEVFEGDVKLSVEPPEHAPCMSPFRAAEKEWLNSLSGTERYISEGWPQGTRFTSGPELSYYCVSECPLNGCSLECPSTKARLSGKQIRVKGVVKKPKLLVGK